MSDAPNQLEVQAEGVVAELTGEFGLDHIARDEVREKILAMKPGETLIGDKYTVKADKNGYSLQTGE